MANNKAANQKAYLDLVVSDPSLHDTELAERLGFGKTTIAEYKQSLFGGTHVMNRDIRRFMRDKGLMSEFLEWRKREIRTVIEIPFTFPYMRG